MQFLSIAERELRVAARKPGSFRLRMLAAGFALFLSGFNLWFVTLFGSRPATGEQLFLILSWASFICACLLGPVLTADCVNEERNNGTLGLLFLTNLRGASIALGKLVGQGLLAVYSIVAIVPVMALPVILGGADLESLGKTALVLLVTLACSLLVGMFASTVFQKAWTAAAVALALIASLVIGIPLAGLILRMNQRPEWAAWLDLFSPSYSLTMANSSASLLPSNRLWFALGAQVLLAMGFFAAVALLLPRVWKEGRSGARVLSLLTALKALRYGSGKVSHRLRTRLLRINPVLWLSCRERFGPMGHAVLILALAFAISQVGQQVRVAAGQTPNDFIGSMIVWIVGMPLLYVIFCFRFAAAASDRFAADRKTGALELILCTPLKTREIVRGHWLGLLRRFWGAALALLALHAFVLHYIIEATRLEPIMQPFGAKEIIVRSLRHVVAAPTIVNQDAPFYIACLAVFTAAILIVVLWIALGWLGMALSLKLKREIFAPWLAFLLLAVPPIPLFACAVAILDDKKLFASNLFAGLLRVGFSGFFIVLVNALLWIFLARRWTYRQLRGAPSGLPGRLPKLR